MERCCWHYELAPGCVTIATVNLVIAAYVLIINILLWPHQWLSKKNDRNILHSTYLFQSTTDCFRISLILCVVLLSVIKLIVSPMLVFAARQKQKLFLFPWLAYTCFEIVALTVCISFAAIYVGLPLIVVILLFAIEILLQFYFLIVVFSFLKKLTKKVQETKEIPVHVQRRRTNSVKFLDNPQINDD